MILFYRAKNIRANDYPVFKKIPYNIDNTKFYLDKNELFKKIISIVNNKIIEQQVSSNITLSEHEIISDNFQYVMARIAKLYIDSVMHQNLVKKK